MAFSKAALAKIGRSVGAAVLGGAVTLILSPSVTDLVPSHYAFLVTGLVVPALIALDKKLFNQTPVVPTPAPAPAPAEPQQPAQS